MRPVAWLGIEPKENIGGKETAKKHHFRSEEEPDPDLGVPKTRIGPGGDGVGNFHCEKSLGVRQRPGA